MEGKSSLLDVHKVSRYMIWKADYRTIHPPIHCSMGSALVDAQCPLTSSLGEFLGYRDWFWYPGLSPVLVSIALPFAFHISVFLFTLLHLSLDFIRLFFTVAVSAPHHQHSSLLQTWDWIILYPKRLRYHGDGVRYHGGGVQ